MLDSALSVLAQVHVEADLTLEAAGGGRARLTNGVSGSLRLNCDRAATLWAFFDTFRATGAIGSFRDLRRLRSPFLQTIELEIDDRDVLLWRPGRYPKIVSLRGMIDLLKNR